MAVHLIFLYSECGSLVKASSVAGSLQTGSCALLSSGELLCLKTPFPPERSILMEHCFIGADVRWTVTNLVFVHAVTVHSRCKFMWLLNDCV